MSICLGKQKEKKRPWSIFVTFFPDPNGYIYIIITKSKKDKVTPPYMMGLIKQGINKL